MKKTNMKTWKTQDGENIPYGEIEDSHLLNILKWIEKGADNGIMCIRGGGSQPEDIWYEEIEIEGEEVLEHYDYKGLKKEAKKRKLM